MINATIEAISIALGEEFGDRYEIHMEDIEQGLKEPCFFISCTDPSERLFLGKRYLRDGQFCIQYFPESCEKNRECNCVAERMKKCLEYVTLKGEDRPIRGSKMKHGIVSGVLNFFVDYDFFVYKTEDQASMETMKISTHVKEGG